MKLRTLIATAILTAWVPAMLPAQDAPAPTVATEQTQQTQQAQQSEHPFINTGFYPQWSKMTPAAAVADVQAAIEIAKARYDAIRSIPPGEETYENVFEALEYADYELLTVSAFWANLTMVRQGDGIQDAQRAIYPVMAAFKASIDSDSGLRDVVVRAAAQPWVQELSQAKQRFVQEQLERFAGGADLTPEQKSHLQTLSAEHTELQRLFNRNVVNSPSVWFHEVKSLDELAGMPEAWIKRVIAQGTINGHTIINLGMATDILRYCTTEETRRICWEGLNLIGMHPDFDNEPVIARIMRIRQQLAWLAGYKNYADKVCHGRMVDSGEKALAFVDDLIAQLRPVYLQENKELLEYVSACKGGPVESIAPWDYAFYREKLARERNDFDVESVRPYFRSDNVLRGMFAVASKLYDITITQERSAFVRPGETAPEGCVEVWHPSVMVFKVTDNKTGAHLGSFYYDPYPRYSKQWGAWTQAMRPGRPGKDGAPHEPHLIVLATNFEPPTRSGHALFAPREVEQLFHEFGHVMHNILSDTEIHLHAGTYVVLDFAELPSQLFENWAWEPEVISTFAFHHETGEPMPAELMEKLVKQRYFMPATAAMEKLFTAKLDLEMHMHYAEKFAGKPLDEACNEILAPIRIPMTVLPPSPMRGCIHCLARNYAAGYFCYDWADVLAADAFSRFKKEGILNPETGAAFRYGVLRYGSDKPAEELYRGFMGRDPDPAAILRLYGTKD